MNVSRADGNNASVAANQNAMMRGWSACTNNPASDDVDVPNSAARRNA